MRKAQVVGVLLSGLLAGGLAPRGVASAQRRRASRRVAAVCGDPSARCRTSVQFEPYQLPFEVPRNYAIAETEKFYAVILKSVRDTTMDCTQTNLFIPEADRLEAQKLFPHNKVFASRCYEAGNSYYEGIDSEVMFMAVYAGRTRAEGRAVLARVKATGKYPDAYLKRTSTGFNGT